MHKLSRFPLCFYSLIAFLFIAGCMGPGEALIQGTWQHDDPHLRNIPAEQHLTTTWAFDRGNFYYHVCCFNIDEEIRGRYRVLKFEENAVTIELFNTSGSGFRFTGEVRIELDPQAGMLNIQGAGPYTRISP